MRRLANVISILRSCVMSNSVTLRSRDRSRGFLKASSARSCLILNSLKTKHTTHITIVQQSASATVLAVASRLEIERTSVVPMAQNNVSKLHHDNHPNLMTSLKILGLAPDSNRLVFRKFSIRAVPSLPHSVQLSSRTSSRKRL